MNDLTKEAGTDDFGGLGLNIKRDRLEIGAFQISEELMKEMRLEQMRGYRNAYQQPEKPYLDESRPLTGGGQYLTGYEGSRCDQIDVLPKPDPRLEIDAFMNGHSEGMAAGMTLMEQSIGGEESRTGIDPDKLKRISDDYRRISDEVEQEIGE